MAVTVFLGKIGIAVFNHRRHQRLRHAKDLSLTHTIGLYLVGYKGFHILTELLNKLDNGTIGFVVAARDSGVSRDYFEEIEALANEHSLRFLGREDVKDNQHPAASIKYAIGWKWLLPSDDNLVIFHDSLLPKYRGFAPVVNSLLAGEKQLGVTALKAAEKYDTGPIVAQTALDISYPIKIQEAIEQLTPLYTELALSVYSNFVEGGKLTSHYQDENEATYSPWRDTRDYLIPWSETAAYIQRFCDAVGPPYAGATTYWGSKAVRVRQVAVVADVAISDRAKHLGKVIDKISDSLIVICGSGLLQIREAHFDDTGQSIFDKFPLRVRFTDIPQ